MRPHATPQYQTTLEVHIRRPSLHHQDTLVSILRLLLSSADLKLPTVEFRKDGAARHVTL